MKKTITILLFSLASSCFAGTQEDANQISRENGGRYLKLSIENQRKLMGVLEYHRKISKTVLGTAGELRKEKISAAIDCLELNGTPVLQLQHGQTTMGYDRIVAEIGCFGMLP